MAAEELLTLAQNPPFADAAIISGEVRGEMLAVISAEAVILDLDDTGRARIGTQLDGTDLRQPTPGYEFLHQLGGAIVYRADSGGVGDSFEDIHCQLSHATPADAQWLGRVAGATYVTTILANRLERGTNLMVDGAFDVAYDLTGGRNRRAVPAAAYREADRAAVVEEAEQYLQGDPTLMLSRVVNPALDRLYEEADRLTPAEASTHAARFWAGQAIERAATEVRSIAEVLPSVTDPSTDALRARLNEYFGNENFGWDAALLWAIVDGSPGAILRPDVATPLQQYTRGVRRVLAFVALASSAAGAAA